MCGRAAQQGEAEEFKQYVLGFEPEHDLHRGNIKPTQNVQIVVGEDKEIKTVEAAWWFEKEGAKEFSNKFSTFNARSENLKESFLYRGALKHQRCLIPVSSFYEWKQ